MKRRPNKKLSSLRLIALAAVPATLMTLHANVFASCGCASCPIDVNTQEKIEAGNVRLDYSYEYVEQDQPRIGRDRASVGGIPGHHDEVYTLSETRRLGVEAGLLRRWSLRASVPFVHVEHTHIHHHQGADINESWNFDGMGDLTLLNRVVVVAPRRPSSPALSVLAGGILPIGRDRALSADGDEAEAGILPGKSAYSLILGLSDAQTFTAPTLTGATANMPFFFSTTYQWNGRGHDDYKIGDIYLANIGLTYPILPKIGLMNQVNFRVNREDGQGKTSEEVEKTGGTYVFYSPGLQLTLNENLWSYLYVQIPIYQRVNEIQLTSNFNLFMGLSYKFSVL